MARWIPLGRYATVRNDLPGRSGHRRGRAIFQGAGIPPHGLAWQDGDLWCVETNDRAFYRYELETGEAVEKIVVDGPEPHGMTIHDGQFWYCDADSKAIATVPLPG